MYGVKEIWNVERNMNGSVTVYFGEEEAEYIEHETFYGYTWDEIVEKLEREYGVECTGRM